MSAGMRESLNVTYQIEPVTACREDLQSLFRHRGGWTAVLFTADNGGGSFVFALRPVNISSLVIDHEVPWIQPI